MIKHFLNRWYIRVQRKKPQTAKYSLYVWSLSWLWYIFAKIKTKITMPCEDFYTILIKQICNFQAEYSIKSIETSIFFFKSDLNEFTREKPPKQFSPQLVPYFLIYFINLDIKTCKSWSLYLIKITHFLHGIIRPRIHIEQT